MFASITCNQFQEIDILFSFSKSSIFSISNKSSQILGLSNRANQFTDHDLRGHISSSEGTSLENVRWNKTDC